MLSQVLNTPHKPDKPAQIFLSPERQIYTGITPSEDSVVEALAINELGNVCFTGSIYDCVLKYQEQFIGARKVESLAAGYVDSHHHALNLFPALAGTPSVAACNTIEEARMIVKNAVKVTPEGQIAIVLDVDLNKHPFDRDFVEQFDKPVFLIHRSYHRGLGNVKAIRFLGLSLDHPDVTNGWVRALDDHLYDHWALPENMAQNILDFQEMLLSQGTTGVHDMLIHTMNVINVLDELGDKIILNPSLYIRPHVVADAKNRIPLDRFAGQKSLCDGAIGAMTARFDYKYVGQDHRGLFYRPFSVLKEEFLQAIEHGLQIACHGIGSAGIRRILDVVEELAVEGHKVEGFRIEHCEFISQDDLLRLVDLGGMASFQPNFSQDDYDYESILGQEKVMGCNPLRQAVEAGLPFGLGSDGMPSGFRECLLWATRPRRVSQALTLAEASHYASDGSESLVSNGGGLGVGYPANFVVFGKKLDSALNSFERPIETNWARLREQLDERLPITATFVKGKCVYGSIDNLSVVDWPQILLDWAAQTTARS